MLKYLRLVFNDHFVIALMFFVGGLGLAYSNWLKTVGPRDTWILFVIGAFLWLGLRIGRIATLIEPADPVFLLPRERDFQEYLGHAWRYSWWLAQLVQVALVVLTMPLLVLVDHFSGLDLVMVVLTQVLLKDFQLTVSMIRLYDTTAATRQLFKSSWSAPWSSWMTWVVSLLGVGLTLFAGPWEGLSGSLVLAIGFRFWFRWLQPRITVAWRADVKLEANRMLGIYRFFNLFTDVPMVQGTVKRRRYLDWVYRWLPADQRHAFGYLFSRGMARGTEFSNLVARLTVIGAVLLYFSGHGWLAMALDVLFIYLIGFQLLPFYKRYDNIVFTHIYPVALKRRLANFQRLLTVVLSVTAIIFLIAFWASNASLVEVGILTLINAFEIYLLVALYAKVRLA